MVFNPKPGSYDPIKDILKLILKDIHVGTEKWPEHLHLTTFFLWKECIFLESAPSRLF